MNVIQVVSTILLLIGAGVGGAVGAVVYAHSTFITVREKEDLDKRLDRIEHKLTDIHNYYGLGKKN